ncbi:MAG TPA: hypothetical protein VFD69_01005 [Vicinamibacterales bacterium]|nr:hypothetical protein [Vicinamibacterales bacterium]
MSRSGVGLWKSQADDLPGLGLDTVQTRSRTLERRVHRRNIGEYAAALVVVAIVVPRIWTAPNSVLAAGGAVLLGGIAYVTYRMRAFGSARTMPSDLGTRSGLEFHRAELERQRDLLQNIWTWYLLPFWPGMGLILIGATMERPDGWPFALGTAVLAVRMAFQIAWMNKRSARTLQEMIDRLKENPVVALRRDPPSLTLAQRLSVWFLTSFLGAIAVGFLVGRFFPEVKANVFGLGSLPPVTRDGLFVLVLIVAGVTVQALWWMIRRR